MLLLEELDKVFPVFQEVVVPVANVLVAILLLLVYHTHYFVS